MSYWGASNEYPHVFIEKYIFLMPSFTQIYCYICLYLYFLKSSHEIVDLWLVLLLDE